MNYPSTKSNSVLRALLLGGFALASTALTTRAVDYFWSPGGTGSNYQTAGSGTWATSAAANWSSDGTNFISWPSANTNRAIFGGTDGTAGQYVVSVGGSFNIQGITINADGYILQSSNTTQRILSNNTSGVSIASGKTATFNNVRLNTNSNSSINGGGTLRLETGGYFYSQQSYGISGGSTLVLAGGGTHAANIIVATGSTLTLQNAGSTLQQTNTTGSNGLRMEGTGIINLDAGVLGAYRIYNNGTSLNTTLNLNGGTLRVQGGAASNFLSVSNAFVKEGGVTFDTNGFNASTSQVLQHGGVAPTDGGLTKTGSGRLTLSGAQTYTGATTINEGTLLINGSLSAASAVAVNSSGVLGGTGTINGSVAINSGGTLSPGASPGLPTYTDALTLNTGSTFVFELLGNTESGRGTNFDGVNLTGGSSLLTIQSGVTASLIFNSSGSTVLWSDSFWDTSHSWLVFDNTNNPVLGSAGIFDSIQVGLDSGALATSGSFSFSEDGNGDIYLNYTAVPEPSSAALLALSGLLLLGYRRRNRSS